MSSNFPKPAELPEGGEGGGTSRIRFRPGVNPAELPPFEFSAFSRNLLQEVFSLRNRVHSLENDLLASRLGGGSARLVGGPNELPEGGEGGGGVVVRPPKEIAELPPFVNRELATLVERFSAFEKKVTESIQALTARVDALKR